MTLGQRIKLYRKQAKKSQKDIEQEAQIPQTTLSGWENDKSEPTVSDAIKLAKALKVSVTELIGCSDEQAACLQKTG
jgi:Predicted transcriptional regulators